MVVGDWLLVARRSRAKARRTWRGDGILQVMEQEKTTRRDGVQTTSLVVEGLALVVAPLFITGFLHNYVVDWLAIVLYVLLVLILLLAHAISFKWSTNVVALMVVYALAFMFAFSTFQHFKLSECSWTVLAKSNLTTLQLIIETRTKDDGYYPEFLVGGDRMECWTTSDPRLNSRHETCRRNAAAWKYAVEKDSEYIKSYTALRNMFPWLIKPHYYWSNPEDIAELQRKYGDHYDGVQAPSRFGERHTLMGNVAADHRFADAKWGYPYWERCKGSRDLLTVGLQGQFYYKALYRPGSDQPDGYILMVFGSYADEGLDAFTTVPGGHELDGRLPDGSGIGMGVPVIPELGLEGDGKPDGVLLVLFGGWPWEEEAAPEGERK